MAAVAAAAEAFSQASTGEGAALGRYTLPALRSDGPRREAVRWRAALVLDRFPASSHPVFSSFIV